MISQGNEWVITSCMAHDCSGEQICEAVGLKIGDLALDQDWVPDPSRARRPKPPAHPLSEAEVWERRKEWIIAKGDQLLAAEREAAHKKYLALTGVDRILARLPGKYRCTDNPRMWVAMCPACGYGPLWIHEDTFGEVRLSCLSDCPRDAIDAGLLGDDDFLRPRDPWPASQNAEDPEP